MSSEQLAIWNVGLDEISKSIFHKVLPEAKLIDKSYNAETFLDELADPAPQIILVESAPQGLSLLELAQTYRMKYPTTLLYYLTANRKGFDRKELKKCGFSEIYIFPNDQSIFESSLREVCAQIKKIKSYRAVKLIDVAPDTELDFDVYVYLPANEKHIKISSKGQALNRKKSDTLQKNYVGDLYLPSEQIKDFYKFTAKQLQKLGHSSNLSETEKKELRERAVRDLLCDLYNEKTSGDNIDAGRSTISDCQEIVKNYILSSDSPQSSWYEKIAKMTGSMGDNYSQAANVSTFAALFSIGLGIGKPEDLALAGLLHDIGLVDIPIEIQNKEESELNPQELEIYKTHPQKSIDLIKQRKMIISESVMKMIIQHHERFDGTGFPKGLAGDRIMPEAQILRLADIFEYLTKTKSGQLSMPPVQAVQEIARQVFSNPGASPFDPKIVKRLMALFPVAKDLKESDAA